MKVSVLSQTPQQLKLRFQLNETLTDPEARLAAMQAAVKKVLADKKINVGLEPKLTPAPGPGLVFNCELELFPKVQLPEHLSVKLEAPALVPPNESDLLAAVEALQIRLGESQPTHNPTDWGMLLTIDMAGFVRGEPIPFSFQHQLPLVLKQDAPQADLMNALIGMMPGETRKVSQKLPADYPYAPWRGVEAQYYVTLQDTQRLFVPPADDALAQACGAGEQFNDLLKVLHDQLSQEQRARWRNQIREQIVSQLVSQSKLNLPESWLQAEFQATWKNSDGQAIEAIKSSLPAALSSQLEQKSWLTWQKMAWLKQDQAERLKTRLVLREMGLQAKISLNQAEILHPLQVGSVVAERPELWREALIELKKENKTEVYADQVWLDKVVRWLVQQAQVTYQGQILELS